MDLEGLVGGGEERSVSHFGGGGAGSGMLDLVGVCWGLCCR